ncbi:MAG: DUF929 family protein [Candidatus Dormiibacterota bacterium]
MSKKSMAARRQMREATASGRAGGARQTPRGRTHRRNERSPGRPWGLISAVIGVVAVFVILVIALELSIQGGLKQDTAVLPAPASLVRSVTSVPTTTLAAVGTGTVNNPPINIPASYKAVALSANGLPEVAFVGGEFCPYCALERWSIVLGLSRFGTWSDLHLIRSSVYDTPANVPSFSFAYGAKFSSPYLVFLGREYQSNVSIHHDGAPYKSFQTLPSEIETAFTGIAGGAYPFIDYAGKLASAGSQALPANVGALSGLTWDQVAQKLRDPKSTVAKDVLGGANYVIAATCMVNGQKPGGVCNKTYIQSLEQTLEKSS